MQLPHDVPPDSAEGRRLLREMAINLIALAEGEATVPKVVEAIKAKAVPPPPPPAPPKESAESRRLVKEAAVTSQAMVKETARENRRLLRETAKAAKAAQAEVKREVLKAMTAPPVKPKAVAIPKDVPPKSAEARRIRKNSDDNSNNLIGKRIYKAPIKFVKFKPKFDNQPTAVHSVG